MSMTTYKIRDTEFASFAKACEAAVCAAGVSGETVAIETWRDGARVEMIDVNAAPSCD